VIRVSVELCSGAIRFRTPVWAESIERAVGLAEMRYPDSEARILIPIEPGTFFARGSIAAETIRTRAEATGPQLGERDSVIGARPA
jgi:hypothetical protein